MFAYRQIYVDEAAGTWQLLPWEGYAEYVPDDGQAGVLLWAWENRAVSGQGNVSALHPGAGIQCMRYRSASPVSPARGSTCS